MNKILSISLLISVFFIFLSLTPDVIPPCDSPVVGDHSGAPGETNCSGCHSSPVNPDLPELQFKIGNADSTYILGKKYVVEISIKKPNHDKFGFVCTSLDTTNKLQGVFGVIDAINTRKFNSGGRSYLSHTPCGADSKDSIRWTYNWTAPSTNKGKIKIYMALLVANHDHGLAGDTTYTRVLSLNPDLSSGVNNNMTFQMTKVYPTIINNEIFVEFEDQYDGELKDIELINLESRLIEKWNTERSNMRITAGSKVNSGVYILKVMHNKSIEKFKLLKL